MTTFRFFCNLTDFISLTVSEIPMPNTISGRPCAEIYALHFHKNDKVFKLLYTDFFISHLSYAFSGVNMFFLIYISCHLSIFISMSV